MCEKHRILRILYHIPSKCGIPIFKFFQKTGHSRSSKRNTQYARPRKRREQAKQNMASSGKGAASSRGTAMRRPRSGRQVSTSESPPKRQRRYGLLSSSGLSGSQCSRSSPKGRSSPRRMGPNGSVNRLENRRRICRQPFSGSRTPIRRFPVSPTAHAHHSPSRPRQETEKAVYYASGVTVSSPTVCSSRKTGYLSMSRHLPAKKSPVHQFMHRRILI